MDAIEKEIQKITEENSLEPIRGVPSPSEFIAIWNFYTRMEEIRLKLNQDLQKLILRAEGLRRTNRLVCELLSKMPTLRKFEQL